RDPELVRDELVRVAERDEARDLALAVAQRARIGRARIVSARDEVAAAVAIELVDERPATGDEAVPEIDRRGRIFAPQPPARAIDVHRGFAKCRTRVAILRFALGVLALAARREHGLHLPRAARR